MTTVSVPGVGDLEFPEGMSQQDMAAAIQKNFPQIHQQPQQKPAIGAKDYLAAAPETVMHLASGAIASPVAGLAGIGTMAGNALGLTDRQPADVVNSVQGAMTYNPRTQGGQAATDIVSTPFRKFGEFSDWAGQKTSDLTGSPAAGAAVNTGIQAIPLAIGGRFLNGRTLAEVKAAAPSPQVAAATSIGLKLTPETAGGGFLARATQSLTNSAKLERNLSLQNSQVSDSILRKSVELPDSMPLTRSSLNAAKAPYNAVYGEVAKLPPINDLSGLQADIAAIPDKSGIGRSLSGVADLKQQFSDVISNGSLSPDNMLNEIRQLKSEGNAASKAAYNPEGIALGEAKLKAAAALEKQLQAHIQDLSSNPQSGVRPTLFDEYKNAQAGLAKINTAQRAVQGGHAVPGLLAKQLDKGVPLSGDVRTLAESYGHFDRSLQNVNKIRNSGPFDSLDLPLGAALSLANPAGLAGLLARPALRGLLASDAYQNAAIAGRGSLAIPANAGLVPFAAEQQRLSNDQSLGILDTIPRGLPSYANY